MPRRAPHAIIKVSVVAGWLMVSAVAQPCAVWGAVVPLPRGIGGLPEPTRVDIGHSTMFVQGFGIMMDAQDLIGFYETALPKAGWQVRQLPWQADHEQAVETLKRALRYYGRAMGTEAREAAEARLEHLKQDEGMLRRQIYATDGMEHLIVNLWPMKDDDGTMVFLNRWSGDKRWLGWGQRPGGHGLDGNRALAASEADAEKAAERRDAPTARDEVATAGAFPRTNVCCSGEEVPDLRAVLPFSVPKYPGAKAVARTTPPGGISTTVLLVVPAALQDVMAYYQEEMPRNTWKSVDVNEAPEEVDQTVQRLQFQRPDRLCTLTFAPVEAGASEDAEAAVSKTLVTVSVRPRVQGGLR